MYQILDKLDTPRRYFTLTIDEAFIAGLLVMLMIGSEHKLSVILILGLLFTALRTLKQGKGPRYLWVLAYWHLPSYMTRWLVHNIPASHLRVWRV
ncbi:MAG: type IV conjugative transfer system protein TraL [Legionellales bacterium RIFCSPHIGHO2_12_FULL_37_14]|nr:MAG: type IV conjugative transfer system protein TraL [Legionellales bacterium RIFCSPHIGHO2_12_FULL_37_14]